MKTSVQLAEPREPFDRVKTEKEIAKLLELLSIYPSAYEQWVAKKFETDIHDLNEAQLALCRKWLRDFRYYEHDEDARRGLGEFKAELMEMLKELK